ncbi:putative tetratricopeptide-like helical domain superfamily [Helianthus debilis subsp. tardiflorus]
MDNKCKNIDDYEKVPYIIVSPLFIFINCYLTLGHWDEADKALKEMLEMGIHASAITYTILIKAHASMLNMESAEAVLNTMLQNRVIPDQKTIASLIHVYCELGEIINSRRHFDSLPSFGFRPNIITYNMLLDGYFMKSYSKEGLELFQEMSEKGAQSECGNIHDCDKRHVPCRQHRTRDEVV